MDLAGTDKYRRVLSVGACRVSMREGKDRSWAHHPGAEVADTKAMDFDGVNDYAYVGDTGIGYFGMNDNDHGAWSVSIWFKTTQSSSYQWLWSIYDHGHSDWARIFLGVSASAYSVIYQMNSSPFDWDGGADNGVGSTGSNPYIGQEASGSSNPVCDGAWHHVAVTCEGTSSTGKVKLYVDGSLASTGTQATAVVDPDRRHRVSGYDYNDTLNFDGRVAQLALIKDELTAGEVSGLYNSGAGTDPTDDHTVYGYYRFGDHDDDTTSLVKDGGTGSNDMTAYNSPTIVTDSPA